MSASRSLSQGALHSALLLVTAASLALLGGCLIINKEHCGYAGEGAENACPVDHVCNPCAVENNGCVPLAELSNIPSQCLGTSAAATTIPMSTGQMSTSTEPTTGGTTTLSTDPNTTEMVLTETTMMMTTTTSSSTTSSDMTTGEPICDPMQMVEDPDCADPNKPYCVAVGECGPCSSLGMGNECADLNAAKPVCDQASGRCVQCTKEDTTQCPTNMPGCNSETGQCAPCTEHSECPNTACDIEVGTCFPNDSVIFVENTAGKCFGGDGTEAKPFCTLENTLGKLIVGKPTTIKIKQGASSAMKPLALEAEGYKVALVRADSQTPLLEGSGNTGPTVDVSVNSVVYLSRLNFKFGSGSVLGCTGGTLYIDDVDVLGDGIKLAKALGASACKTFVRRSKFRSNVGGIQIDKGELRMENSYVVDNATIGAAFGAFEFIGNPTVLITYSTIILHVMTKSSSTFSCTGGDTNVKVRNSAVLGLVLLQKGCTFVPTTSVFQDAATPMNMEAFEADWFSGELDGAFKVKEGGPLSGKAKWVMGDPLVDYDGTVRSKTLPSDAGADESQQ